MSLIIGIDASRNRSGGAKAHLVGILSSVTPACHGIQEIHVWSFRSLLDSLPDRPWLIKHNPDALEKSLGKQLWWQMVNLKSEVVNARCQILFTTDASTLCHFKPMVVLSQDMLSYEQGVMKHFGLGYARLRLLAILYIQNAAFRRAQGVIFLTQYAARVIQDSCGHLNRISIVPHGIGEAFLQYDVVLYFPIAARRQIRCVYVSPVSRYKHQWVVVRAFEMLRQRGYDLSLELVGADDGTAQSILSEQIGRSDPDGLFVKQVGALPQSSLPSYLANADLFVFASSCENMPVTLLEAMAIGLPIACSDRGPMPEILNGGGVYFDPDNPDSIALAIEKIITDEHLRAQIIRHAKAQASQYSWDRCAEETFAFITQTYQITRRTN